MNFFNRNRPVESDPDRPPLSDLVATSNTAPATGSNSVAAQLSNSVVRTVAEHPANGLVPPARDAAAHHDQPMNLTTERRRIIDRLADLSPKTDAYATEFIDGILEFAARVGTSDVHLQPTSGGYDVRFRDDGILKPIGVFPAGANTSIIARLKVLSNLLTYQSEIPQEGRISVRDSNPDDVPTIIGGAEVRVSTFPTLHGERAVMRFFAHHGEYTRLEDLGHNETIVRELKDALAETSGAVLICGPAGSGKSTTMYACLRYLVATSAGSRSILTIEDPIEVPLQGVAQSQINNAAGFDLQTGLKSLLRQDPEVFCVGEIRDPLTAEIALQACLAGQFMMATFHADSVATAITRLIDMDVDPYQLRSGLIGILCQRLVRKLCVCAAWTDDQQHRAGWPFERVQIPRGCDQCLQTGYAGRVIVGEYLSLKESRRSDELIDRKDSRQIYRSAVEGGMTSIWENAAHLIRDGITSPDEIRRVLGYTHRI